MKREDLDRDWDLHLNLPAEHLKALKAFPDYFWFIGNVLSGFVDTVVDTQRKNVLFCAQPKSAGLYLVQLLASALGLTNYQVGFNKNAGEVYYPRMLCAKYSGLDTISHCHAAPSRSLISIALKLRFRPLVLTRNLLDTLVSRRDMLIRDVSRDRTGSDGGAGEDAQRIMDVTINPPEILSPAAIRRFLDAPAEGQMDVVIDAFAGQYINFFSSWKTFEGTLTLRPCFITYEELAANEPALVRRVAQWLEVECDDERTRSVSTSIRQLGGINFSKGVAGRGAASVTAKQVDRLRQIARSFGCEDEAYLGFELD